MKPTKKQILSIKKRMEKDGEILSEMVAMIEKMDDTVATYEINIYYEDGFNATLAGAFPKNGKENDRSLN